MPRSPYMFRPRRRWLWMVLQAVVFVAVAVGMLGADDPRIASNYFLIGLVALVAAGVATIIPGIVIESHRTVMQRPLLAAVWFGAQVAALAAFSSWTGPMNGPVHFIGGMIVAAAFFAWPLTWGFATLLNWLDRRSNTAATDRFIAEEQARQTDDFAQPQRLERL